MQTHLCWDLATESSSSHGQRHKQCPLIFLKACTDVSTDAASESLLLVESTSVSSAMLIWFVPGHLQVQVLFLMMYIQMETWPDTKKSWHSHTDEEETQILRAVFYFMEDLKKDLGLWPCADCGGLWNCLGSDVLWALLSCYILQSHKNLNSSRQMAYNSKSLKPVAGDQMKMRETLPKSL